MEHTSDVNKIMAESQKYYAERRELNTKDMYYMIPFIWRQNQSRVVEIRTAFAYRDWGSHWWKWSESQLGSCNMGIKIVKTHQIVQVAWEAEFQNDIMTFACDISVYDVLSVKAQRLIRWAYYNHMNPLKTEGFLHLVTEWEIREAWSLRKIQVSFAGLMMERALWQGMQVLWIWELAGSWQGHGDCILPPAWMSWSGFFPRASK